MDGDLLEAAPASRKPAVGASWPLLVSISLLLIAFLATCASFNAPGIARMYFLAQDRWLALIVAGLLLLSLWLPARRIGPILLNGRRCGAIAIAIAVLAFAGHYLLLSDFDFSRDEQMVTFDRMVFASGHLVQPLPALWQQHVGLLNIMYMPQIDSPVAWISAYLPVNAALQALVGLIGPPALAPALFAAASALALWRCARTLWPDDRETSSVTFLLFVTSGQLLFTAMSPFAMSAHLCVNLIWLMLFLRRRVASDLAALAIGFIGTGLHQPLFHPMFVAPWLLLLLLERQWKRLALFGVGYLAIGIFWLAWPAHVAALLTGPRSTLPGSGLDFWTRLRDQLQDLDLTPVGMTNNLLRFGVWQSALLIPLALAGVAAVRADRRALALLLGILLPIGVMTVILPNQGNGFGYRYLHGLLGNAALLGGYGWQRLRDERPRLRTLLASSLIVTLIVMWPFQAWTTYRFYAPLERADRAIDASGADYLVIGPDEAPFAYNLVLNKPDLSNRPLRLAPHIPELVAAAPALCRNGATFALPSASFYWPISADYGEMPRERADELAAQLAPTLARAGCKVQRVP